MTTSAAFSTPSYFPMGDQAIVVQFENEISLQVSRRVHIFAHLIKQNPMPGITQVLPAFHNLTVCYDAAVVDYDQVLTYLENLEGKSTNEMEFKSKTIHLPVVFGGEYGPDLEHAARHADVTTDEVVDMLQSKPYFVYMIGFIAAYPYCGDIDRRLMLPRRTTPRIKVPKGTVQIANNLSGILTMAAPTGWHLMGWTPMELFNPYAEPPSMLQAGDYVKYIPIMASEAEEWDENRQRKWDQEWNSSLS